MAKADVDFKRFIEGLLGDQRHRFLAEMEGLEGKAFVDRYLQLIEYVQPKLSRQEVDQTLSMPVAISFIPAARPIEIEGEVIEEDDTV